MEVYVLHANEDMMKSSLKVKDWDLRLMRVDDASTMPALSPTKTGGRGAPFRGLRGVARYEVTSGGKRAYYYGPPSSLDDKDGNARKWYTDTLSAALDAANFKLQEEVNAAAANVRGDKAETTRAPGRRILISGFKGQLPLLFVKRQTALPEWMQKITSIRPLNLLCSPHNDTGGRKSTKEQRAFPDFFDNIKDPAAFEGELQRFIRSFGNLFNANDEVESAALRKFFVDRVVNVIVYPQDVRIAKWLSYTKHNVNGARTDVLVRAGGALLVGPVLDAAGHGIATAAKLAVHKLAVMPWFQTKVPLGKWDQQLDWLAGNAGGWWRAALVDAGAETRSKGRASLFNWGLIADPDSLAALKSALSGERAAAHREAVEQVYGALKKELPPRSRPASKFMTWLKSIFSAKPQGLPRDPVGRVVTSFFPPGGSKVARIMKHEGKKVAPKFVKECVHKAANVPKLRDTVSKMFPNTFDEIQERVEKGVVDLCDKLLSDEGANNDDERRAGLLFTYGSLVDYAREADQFSQRYFDILDANEDEFRTYKSTHVQIQHRIELMEELYRLTIEPSADVGEHFLKSSRSQSILERERKRKYFLDSMKTLWRESERKMLPGPYEPEEESSPSGGTDSMPRINYAYTQDVQRYTEHLTPVLFQPEYDFMLSYTNNNRDVDLTRERAERLHLHGGEDYFGVEQDDPDKPTSFYELTTHWLFAPSEESLSIFLNKYGCAIRVQRMLRPSWTEAEREKHVQAFESKLRESYPTGTPLPDAIAVTVDKDGKKKTEDPISRYRTDAKLLAADHNQDASRDEIIADLGDRFMSLFVAEFGNAAYAAWAQDFLTALARSSEEKMRDWLLAAFLPRPQRLQSADRQPGSSFHGFLRGAKRDQIREGISQWVRDAGEYMVSSSLRSRGSRQRTPSRGDEFLLALLELDVIYANAAVSPLNRMDDELRGELEVRTNVNAWQKSNFYLEERFVPGTAEWEQEEKSKLPSIVDAMFEEVEKRKDFVQFVMPARSRMGPEHKFLQVPAPRQDEKDPRHGPARYFVRVLLLPLLEQVLQERLFRLELRKKILFETALRVLLNGAKRADPEAVKTKKLKDLFGFGDPDDHRPIHRAHRSSGASSTAISGQASSGQSRIAPSRSEQREPCPEPGLSPASSSGRSGLQTKVRRGPDGHATRPRISPHYDRDWFRADYKEATAPRQLTSKARGTATSIPTDRKYDFFELSE
ncbi:unnamed protein product [Amoebophrya sp. A120]|nr:unnamed protein product [Amoebophrya sp. A120]|eukprot:GSA120T00025144001.1